MCGTKLRRGLLLLQVLLLVCLPFYLAAQEPSEMTTDEILSELVSNLQKREQILSEREQLLQKREESLNEQAQFLQTIEQSLNERETSADRRLHSLTEIEDSLKNFSAAVKWEIWTRNALIALLAGAALWGWLR